VCNIVLVLGIAPATLVMIGVKLPIVVPLIIACLALMVFISVSACKGKLHIPGYIGIAFLAFGSSLLFGSLAGIKALRGTTLAITLSIAFYLCIATTIGSIVALLFYRRPIPESDC
jgi:hypothetical protein